MRRRPEATSPPRDADPGVFLPLPPLPFHVLLALADGAHHGGGIIHRIGRVTGSGQVPSSGSLYLAMNRLEERGLIAAAEPPDGADARRRYLRLTSLGRRVLAAETQRLAHLVDVSRNRMEGSAGLGRAGPVPPADP